MERLISFIPFTWIANVTGQPAMSVPFSRSADGLPLGVHFTGRYGEEELLFAIAGQIERARPWRDVRPRHVAKPRRFVQP